MTLEQRVVKGLRELAPSDRRVVADLVDFLRSRKAAHKGTKTDEEGAAWRALAARALFRDADHPDEVDYSLADVHEGAAR